MRGLRILLLGPPRLELDGQPLTRLIALKHQALVYYLAAKGSPVTRAELATLLWETLDEAAARANLRVALTRLRRWLPELLDIDARQVGFAPGAPLAIDLDELHAALDPSMPHDARVAAARAWRGPLLDGMTLDDAEGFERWLAATRQRALRDAVQLRHALAAHARGVGRSDEALAHLRALLEIDDADEPAHMALMELLGAAGQRTAALAQYEACRAALAERLGARPSAACYGLYVRIHADAPALAAPDVPSQDVPLARVAAAAPAPAAAPVVAGAEEPASEPEPLVGRDVELAQVGERLADAQCRWLTLVGPGGVGKSRLARAAADRFGTSFRHGALWLSGREPGGPLRDATALAQHVFEQTGADRDGPGALLLVLDNLDALPRGRELVQALQARVPGISVLATSRRRLGGSREWLLELPGLSLAPDAEGRPGSSAAAALFAQAARRLDPGFDLQAQAADVDRLCQLVGGLPLALGHAARVRQRIGLAAVIERLRAGELLADPGPHDAEQHHRSLRVVLDESWSALDERARAAALRLACLPGGFDMGLAAAVGAAPQEVDTLREHSWLSRDDAGLLALHPLQQDYLRRQPQSMACRAFVGDALVRHTLAALPPIAPFGPWPEDGAAAERIAAQPAFGSSELLGALEHLLAGDDTDTLAAWVDGVAAVLIAARRAAEAAALLARAAAGCAELPVWRTEGWRLRQGETVNALGDGEGARRIFESALGRMGVSPLPPEPGTAQGLLRSAWRLATRRGWPALPVERQALRRLLLRCLMFLGQQHTFAPQTLAAVRTLAVTPALNLAPRSQAVKSAIRLSNAYGAALFGFTRVARSMSRGQMPRPRLRDDPHLDAFIDHTHAALQVALGQWEGLRPRIEATVAAFERLGDHRHEMEAHSLLGKLLFYQGQLPASAARFRLCRERGLQLPAGAYRSFGPFGLAEVGMCLDHVSLAELRELADTGGHWITEMENMDSAYTLRRLGLLARLAWRADDVTQAREAVLAGIAAAGRFRRCGFWAHEGYAGIGEGLLLLRRHEREVGGPLPPLDRAWATLQRALEGHVRRFPPARAMGYRLQGQALLEQGRPTAARQYLARAVREAELRGMPVELARSCDALAPLESTASCNERARRVWAEVRRA